MNAPVVQAEPPMATVADQISAQPEPYEHAIRAFVSRSHTRQEHRFVFADGSVLVFAVAYTLVR